MAGTLTATANGLFLRIGAPPLPSYRITWDKLLTAPKTERISGTQDTTTIAAATEATNWTQTDSVAPTDAKTVVKLDLVSSDEQAQQLAAVADAKSGPTEKITCQVGIAALDLVPGDAVDVDLQPMAYGRFEVVGATINLDVVPTVDLILERQRASIYSDYPTTPATAQTVTVNPRQLAAPTFSIEGGSFPTASWPVSVAIFAHPGALIRYSFASAPATITDGSAYYGSVSLPAPGVGNYRWLYATAFRVGWTPQSHSQPFEQT